MGDIQCAEFSIPDDSIPQGERNFTISIGGGGGTVGDDGDDGSDGGDGNGGGGGGVRINPDLPSVTVDIDIDINDCEYVLLSSPHPCVVWT